MKVLFDANVVLDILLKRPGFAASAFVTRNLADFLSTKKVEVLPVPELAERLQS